VNLQLLFKEQQLLRDKIAYDNPDRFEKLVLALLVELGECANEWRGFKFWSKDQEPRRKSSVTTQLFADGELIDEIKEPDETGDPLLEEYVDGLHFVLEIGLELNYTDLEIWVIEEKNITKQFIDCVGRAYNLQFQMRVTGEIPIEMYELLFGSFIGLGKMLGFTWEQIEQAYMEKNAINHQRQEDGY
jgi:dimeric dUTPase (all-alpha-NTP-PPase superfamily)